MRLPRLAVAPLALASVLAAAVTGCSDTAAPGSTQLSVALTDAPGDLQAAVVTISEIDLVGGSGGPIVLSNTETTTDLLTLANTTQTLVDGFEVPVGNYTQLRFVVTGAYIQVDNGDGTSSIYATPDYEHLPVDATVSGTLQAPSFDQSGLKVTMPGDALELTDPEETLLVDFDVSQSFGHAAGGSGQWVMHPVIHGTQLAETSSE